MSGLFSLDDVKLLYAASQINDGDDEKKTASLVPKMQARTDNTYMSYGLT